MQRRNSVLSHFSLRRRWRVWNAICLLVAAFCVLFFSNWWQHHPSSAHRTTLQIQMFNHSLSNPAHKTECRFYTCFEVNRCVFAVEDVLGVYIGEKYDFVAPHAPTISPTLSVEYSELIEAVKGSRYYVSDPSKACVFIPAVDTLSQSSLRANTMSVLLNSLLE